ncbi:hypothetical protein JCM8097_001388 [Rhodosporidiobolus ruineniae]
MCSSTASWHQADPAVASAFFSSSTPGGGGAAAGLGPQVRPAFQQQHTQSSAYTWTQPQYQQQQQATLVSLDSIPRSASTSTHFSASVATSLVTQQHQPLSYTPYPLPPSIAATAGGSSSASGSSPSSNIGYSTSFRPAGTVAPSAVMSSSSSSSGGSGNMLGEESFIPPASVPIFGWHSGPTYSPTTSLESGSSSQPFNFPSSASTMNDDFRPAVPAYASPAYGAYTTVYSPPSGDNLALPAVGSSSSFVGGSAQAHSPDPPSQHQAFTSLAFSHSRPISDYSSMSGSGGSNSFLGSQQHQQHQPSTSLRIPPPILQPPTGPVLLPRGILPSLGPGAKPSSVVKPVQAPLPQVRKAAVVPSFLPPPPPSESATRRPPAQDAGVGFSRPRRAATVKALEAIRAGEADGEDEGAEDEEMQAPSNGRVENDAQGEEDVPVEDDDEPPAAPPTPPEPSAMPKTSLKVKLRPKAPSSSVHKRTSSTSSTCSVQASSPTISLNLGPLPALPCSSSPSAARPRLTKNKQPMAVKKVPWVSTTEFFGPWEEVDKLLDEAGEEIDLDPTISTPSSFDYDASIPAWRTYRRNFLTLPVSLVLSTSTPLSDLHTRSQPNSTVERIEVELTSATTGKGTPVELLQFDKGRSPRQAQPLGRQTLGVDKGASSSTAYTSLSRSSSGRSTRTRSLSSASASTSGIPVAPSTTLSTTFSRVQYRSSTSNHPAGSANADDARFVMRCRVFAVHQDGAETELGGWTSARVVVRGRSPGNFVAGNGKKGKGAAKEGEGEEEAGKGKGKKRKAVDQPSLVASTSAALDVGDGDDEDLADAGSPDSLASLGSTSTSTASSSTKRARYLPPDLKVDDCDSPDTPQLFFPSPPTDET